jgi:hypothetical protein
MKGLITEDTIEVERKGIDPETQVSALHIVIASNAKTPFPIERDDRRYAVFEVDDSFKQDHVYFTALREELDNGGREAALHYFMNYEVDRSMLRNPPDTTAKREMKSASLNVDDQWWLDVLMDADAELWRPWQIKIGNKAIYANYSEWFDRCIKGRAKKHTAQTLGTYLRLHFKAGAMDDWPQDAGRVDYVTASNETRRDHAKRFPPLAVCRRVFDYATGTQNDWPALDDGSEPDGAVRTTAA